MKPIFSDESRKLTVLSFVSAIINGQAKITEYKTITPYLESKRVKILNGMTPHIHKKLNKYGDWDGTFISYYDDENTEVYFNWLMDVVTGAEKATEEVISDAINQLFTFIRVLRESDSVSITENLTLIAPYNWEDKLVAFDDKLTNIEKSIEHRDQEIIAIFTKINKWLKEYTPALDDLKKESLDQLKKVKKADGNH